MEASLGADGDLVESLRQRMRADGNPDRAAGAQAYMKSAMPFHGLALGDVRRMVREVARTHPIRDRERWEATVRALWDGATHREERYAATALARHPAASAWQDPGALELYRHMVVTGAWWDLVDEIASHLVGGIVASHREAATPVMGLWAVDDDMWLRRVAILCQLRHKGTTDVGLLERCIVANLEGSAFGSGFFIRKAIGWALREHAKTDPDWVRDFLARHREHLSGLSVREASRHLA